MDEITRRNIRTYNETVKEFYDKTKSLEPIQMRIREEFVALMRPGAKIIDIGCGPGRDAKFFSERGLRVVGIDLSPNMLKMAREIAPKADFKKMDFLDISFKKGSFDGAWCEAGLVCAEKKHTGKILADINRILKDKGILYTGVKEGTGEGFQVDKRYSHEKYYSYYQEKEIKQYLERQGFRILKVIRTKLKSRHHTRQWIYIFSVKESGPSPT